MSKITLLCLNIFVCVTYIFLKTYNTSFFFEKIYNSNNNNVEEEEEDKNEFFKENFDCIP